MTVTHPLSVAGYTARGDKCHGHFSLTHRKGLSGVTGRTILRRSQCSAFNFSFHKLCLIFKNWFFIRFPPNFQERFLMSSASPEFVFWGPKIKEFFFRVGSCWVFIANIFVSPHQQTVLQSTTFRPGCPSHFQV